MTALLAFRHRTILIAALAGAACGAPPSHNGGGADAGLGTISVSPSTLTVEIDNGVAVTHDYTATLTAPDGSQSDVTDQVTFLVADPTIGYFDHHTLSVTGGGAGLTKVQAELPGIIGEADLKVLIKGRRVDPAAPPNAPDLFGAATTDPNKMIAIAYPADQVIVPQNLGDFEVHWRDNTATDDLFEITLRSDYVDLRVYVPSPAVGWGKYLPAEWSSAAHNGADLQVIVRGLQIAAPQTAATSSITTVHLTNDAIQGGIYYWAAATANGAPEGIWRHDMANPGDPPQQFFTKAETPNGRCVACHAISRDGTRMAVTYDGGDQSSTLLDVGTRATAVDPGIDYWNFATFTPDASKLLTVHQGQLTLRSGADATLLATVPNTGLATHPDFSPKGDQFVYVMRGAGSDWSFSDGSIYTVSYDDATLGFGTPEELVTGGGNNYYPSYSPDGQWILFNRADDNSSAYNSGDAEIWVVKADKSLPPMKLSAADVGPGLTNSWARWAPFQSTLGPSAEPLYWITFSSKRLFGVRPVLDEKGHERPQIWMTAFFPDKVVAGQDGTAPSFRLPFQAIDTNNHIAQWTERVVPVN